MRPITRTRAIVFFTAATAFASAASGAQVPDDLPQRRIRLAAVRAGTTAAQALRDLGKPDEVRRIDAHGLLDGTRVGDTVMLEAERWVYGPLGRGMFAATGYLSVTSDGIVISATPADFFCKPGAQLPQIVHAVSDAPVEASGNRICRIVTVEPVRAQGNTCDSLKVQVAIKNGGTKQFDVKHPAATGIRWLMIVEICDAKGVLLFRDDQSSNSSVHPVFGKPRILSVPPGGELSDMVFVSPAWGFGRLPPGTYFLRVYFPLDGREYYPSNRVRFEVNSD